MSATQRHAEHALRVINELLGLYPIGSGLLIFERDDPRTPRFRDLMAELKIVVHRIGFNSDELLKIGTFDASGTSARDRGWMLNIAPWKRQLCRLREAIQRELDAIHEESRIRVDLDCVSPPSKMATYEDFRRAYQLCMTRYGRIRKSDLEQIIRKEFSKTLASKYFSIYRRKIEAGT